MTDWIDVKAGPTAYQHIQDNGLDVEDIKLLIGASGGPKWFILQGLDNFLFGDWLNKRKSSMNLMGTSAGAWRFASLGRENAAEASAKFSELYRGTVYSEKPDIAEITGKSIDLLHEYVPDSAVSEILSQERFLHHMIVARAKGLNQLESRVGQGIGLVQAMAANAVRRKYLGHHFERVVFHHPKLKKPLGTKWNDLPTRHVPLSQENFREALLATGSIPMVLAGVKNIPGAPKGVYRDGGVTDYHFDLDLSEQEGLALYPHFQREIIPGWFDKKSKRRTTGEHWPNVITIMPTQAFIDALPYGKIPDRNDFADLDVASRQKYWQTATDAGYRMAEQLADWLELGAMPQRVKLWS
ncbi:MULTISPECIES: alpha/beta hydrolase [Gammaproteobacteria]|uniref:alpha/beta hydrolase n=1 Tax=Gammaproteobacteria TaxID=1236 RepID=UPI000DD005EF|nr:MULTISPECIES: alpha/beta hydrolase [Gammaproteobacteria]RTE87047.1 alpha/beta hydrolase [Aliidiomarina sp. B3213]TCZ93163.1 alpha/beta hydrolase [Lysobacter sp. N42]